MRHFGSWSNALVAAGIITRRFLSKLFTSRLVILRAIRDTLESRSQADISQVLRFQAELYFGSLRIAIIVLKKDQRLSHGWSKPKILKILWRMHRAKVGLAYAKVRREFPALVSAAEAYFGSWGNALYAAGIDPNLYFCPSQVAENRQQCSLKGSISSHANKNVTLTDCLLRLI